MKPLDLYANSQKISTLRLEAAVGRPHLMRAHAEARFFANEQFRLKPTADGWIISPVPGAINPTLVNGTPLTTPRPVSNGMIVKVRGAEGLTLELRTLEESTPLTAAIPASSRTGTSLVSPAPHSPPRPDYPPPGDLAGANVTLQNFLHQIEANAVQAQQHRSNAALANAGAAVTYLLTRGSKRETVRTIGNLAAIGGLVYGTSQSHRATALESQNNTLITSSLRAIQIEGLPRLPSATSSAAKHEFLALVLRLGSQVDQAIQTQGNRLKNMSLLGRKNQDLAVNALQVDIIANKLHLHQIYSEIDHTKTFPNYADEFSRQVSSVDAAKLPREGLYAKLIIWGCIILGVILANVHPAGAIILAVGLGFWGINHIFPIFPETRKLKQAIISLIDKLQNTPPTLTLRAA